MEPHLEVLAVGFEDGVLVTVELHASGQKRGSLVVDVQDLSELILG